MKRKLLIFLGVVCFIGLLFLMSFWESSQWNNGYCINCGTKYEAISRTHNGQTYYECPNCYYGCYY